MYRLAAWKAWVGVAMSALSLHGVVGCSSDDSEPDGPTGSVTWCQASEVLAAKCQRCHVGEGLHGAPFPLVTFEDTQVQSETTGTKRWQQMAAMVSADFMPPEDPRLDPPPAKLTSAEKELLMTWFDEGAQAVGGTSCD
jgi:hypothetical protein